MSRGQQAPISQLIKQGKQLDDEDQATKRKRNDFREQKELEEQRKAGTAPAMVDVETGRDINPHIPEFIEKTPWYVQTDGPTLKHQRPHPEREKRLAQIDEWYKKGTTGMVASKFRKGACENCGAMGHNKKNCFEKPRKKGAKYTDQDIAPDDYVQANMKLGFDAKRDRWNGYDPATYSETVIKEHERIAEISKVLRAEKLNNADGAEEVAEEKDAEEVDEDNYADEMAPGQTVDMDSRTRITVRNLRIREDTAVYLHNLNENGPYYDPKSRSMRENPFLGVKGKEAEAARFAGGNYIKYTGEVQRANEAQCFAWEARSKGIDVHASAEPTKLEFLQRTVEEEKEKVKEAAKQALLDRYGGEQHLEAPPKELLFAQTEDYVEYNQRGAVLRGPVKLGISKDEENKLINNHTTIYGSYKRDGQLGYACCHQLLMNSYCIGEKGLELERQQMEENEGDSKVKTLKPKLAELICEDPTPSATEVAASTAQNESDDDDDEESEHADNDDDVVEEEAPEESDEETKREREEEREREKERRERKERKRKAKAEKRKRQAEKRRARKAEDSSKKKKKRRRSSSSSSSSSSDSDSEKNAKKSKYSSELREAIKKANREQAEGRAIRLAGDRGNTYNSFYENKAPTEIEIEAYNLTKSMPADPMASYLNEKRDKEAANKK